MNKLKAWFIAKEGLKVLAIDKFIILEISLIAKFSFFISCLKFFDNNLLLQRIMFKIINNSDF